MLVTYRRPDGGPPRLGVQIDDRVLDVADADAPRGGAAPLPGSMLELLRLGDAGLDRVRALADRAGTAGLALADVRLCAPLPRPNSLRDFMLVEEHVKNSFGQ